MAIIAILAAIAVPNFLEAQTRAKVSRCQADMRTIATALELYHVDHNKPMTCRTDLGGALTGPSLINPALPGTAYVSYRFKRLTTPIAYINSVVPDVFTLDGRTRVVGSPNPSPNYDSFDYFDAPFNPSYGSSRTSGGNWRIAGTGPDKIQAFGGAQVGYANNYLGVDYDASNGTVSTGDIVRVGGAGPVTSILASIDRVRNIINDPAIR